MAVAVFALTLIVSLVTSFLDLGPSDRTVARFVAYAVSYGAAGMIVIAIWRGKNWARVLYTLLMGFGIAFTATDVLRQIAEEPFSSLFTISMVLLQLGGVAMIFGPLADPWFGREEKGQSTN